MHCPQCGRALRIPTTQAEAEAEHPRRRALVRPESLMKVAACVGCAASLAAFVMGLVSTGAGVFRAVACPAAVANAGALTGFLLRKESARWAALAASTMLVLCGGAILVVGTGWLTAALGAVLAFNGTVVALLASDAAEAYTSEPGTEPEEMPDDV